MCFFSLSNYLDLESSDFKLDSREIAKIGMFNKDSFFEYGFIWLPLKIFFRNYGEVNKLSFFGGWGIFLSIFCFGVSIKVDGWNEVLLYGLKCF